MNEPLHSTEALMRFEKILDQYACGSRPRPKELARLQAHSATCEYCALLLGAAEDIRSRVAPAAAGDAIQETPIRLSHPAMTALRASAALWSWLLPRGLQQSGS